MERDRIIEILRGHETELRDDGVTSVSIFGSLARGELSPGDVDLAIGLDASKVIGGLSYFSGIERLRERLERIIGAPVDIVTEPVRNKTLQDAIDRDRRVAFS